MSQSLGQGSVSSENRSSQRETPHVAVQTDENKVQRGVEKLADSGKFTIETMMAMGGAMGNPLQSKMTTEHISQVLDLGASHDEREYELAKRQQELRAQKESRIHKYGMAYFVIIVALIVFVLLWFKDTPTVLVPIISAIAGLASGFLAGVGFGKASSK